MWHVSKIEATSLRAQHLLLQMGMAHDGMFIEVINE